MTTANLLLSAIGVGAAALLWGYDLFERRQDDRYRRHREAAIIKSKPIATHGLSAAEMPPMCMTH